MEQSDNSQASAISFLKMQSFGELQLTVKKFKERHVEMRQANHELCLQEASLGKQIEKNREILLDLQMKVEEDSSGLGDYIKHRQTLEHKTQHAIGVCHSFHSYWNQVNYFLSELSKSQRLSEEFLSEASRRLNQCELEAQEVLVNQLFPKTRHLLSELQAVQAEKDRHANLVEAFNQTSSDSKSHYDDISSLKTEHDHCDVLIKDMSSELVSFKEYTRDQREAEHEKNQAFDEEIQDIDAQVAAAKSIQESLDHDLKARQKEKECCLSQLDMARKEIHTITESLSTIEAEKYLLEKKENEVNGNLFESENMLKDSLENLQRLQTQNDEIQAQITSQHQEFLQCAQEKSYKLSKLSEELSTLSSTYSARLGQHNQASQSADLDLDEATQIIKKTMNEISNAKSELQEISQIGNEEESQNSLLNSQLTTKNSEVQNLQSEKEQMQKYFTDERKKVLSIDNLLQQQQELTRQEEKKLQCKLKDVKEKILERKDCLCDTKERLVLLNQTFDDIKMALSVKEASANHQFASEIVEHQQKITQLTELKKQMTAENEKNSTSLFDALQQKNSSLAMQEQKITEACKVNAALLKDITVSRHTLVDLNQALTAAEECAAPLNETLKKLQNDTDEFDEQLHDMDSLHLQRSKVCEAKIESLISLKHKIDEFEKRKTEALLKNNTDMKTLLNDMVQSKQTCESLLSKTSQINLELDCQKKTVALAKTEVERVQASLASYNIRIGSSRKSIEQRNSLLKKLRKDKGKNKERAENASLELQIIKDEYQIMVKQIHDAKTRKRARVEGSSVLEEQNMIASTLHASASQTKEKESTPRSILKQPIKQPTPQSAKKSVSFLCETSTSEVPEKQTTPRPILKATQQPTPPSAKKAVSFLIPPETEDVESH